MALLDAEKLEVRVLDDGTVVTVPVPDNQTRQRATESAFDLVGAKQSIKEVNTDNGTKLTLILPNYYSQEFLDKEKGVINVTGQVVDKEDDQIGHVAGDSMRESVVEYIEPLAPIQPVTDDVVAPSNDGQS